jgi:ethanolamine utilization protein EutP
VDQSRPVEVYPPAFAKSFSCPVVGVITKSDLAPNNSDVCIQQLKKAGVREPYFRISLQDKAGVQALKDYLLGTSNLK